MTLYQLQERLHNAAFAGADLVGEDFRLHKAIEQFSEMSSKNPVFAKIYQTIRPLADSSVTDKTSVLLEAVTLVDAVCTTMAVTAKPENAEKTECEKPSAPEQYRYSDISDVIYALTSTGGGRYKIISAAYEADPKIFKDHRLIPLLYKGIDDSYSENGILCGKILINTLGESAANRIRDDFMSIYNEYRNKGIEKLSREKAKSAMNRRLSIISERKEKENDFYISLIKDEDMFSDIKYAAVRALRYDEKNTDLLIELAKSKDDLSAKTYKGQEQLMIMKCVLAVLKEFNNFKSKIAVVDISCKIREKNKELK